MCIRDRWFSARPPPDEQLRRDAVDHEAHGDEPGLSGCVDLAGGNGPQGDDERLGSSGDGDRVGARHPRPVRSEISTLDRDRSPGEKEDHRDGEDDANDCKGCLLYTSRCV